MDTPMKTYLSICLAVGLVHISTSATAALGGAVLESCGNGTQAANINKAFGILGKRFSKNYGKFKQCMDDAYLVEYQRHSGHTIARKFVNAKVTKVKCTELNKSNGEAPIDIKKQKMKIDHNFARSQKPKRIASVIAHELAHNLGYGHPGSNDFGGKYYGNTVPEQVEACILNGKPNPWPGPGSARYRAKDVVGMALDGDNNYSFVYYRDGTVSAGSTTRVHEYRVPQRYSLPAGKNADDIVGMALDGDNNYVFAWYRDGTVSAGTSVDLDKFRKPYRYKLPNGYSPNDIVGMAMDGDTNTSYAWYKNGKVSGGSSDDLGKKRSPYNYSLPAGKKTGDIAGMAIDGDNNTIFTWYTDATVSAGSTDNLSYRRERDKVRTGR